MREEASIRTPSGGYGQIWAAYNQAQDQEQELFVRLLHELCQEIEEPAQDFGRPRLPLRDMLFCLVFKSYYRRSARRSKGLCLDAFDAGWIDHVPHFNSVAHYLEQDSLTPLLHKLIEMTAQPLSEVENVFAVDSSGLKMPERCALHKRRLKRRRQREHLKLHVICGVQTNIITTAEVTEGTEHDSPQFIPLVEQTSRFFELREVSADAAYLDARNMRAVLWWGATPYIAFRKNCTAAGEAKSTFWKWAVTEFQNKGSDYREHYYLRNNVEATFSMLKRKFGAELYSKCSRGQGNEALCKVICHNICVLIQSIFKLGIQPSFSTTPVPRRQPDALLSAVTAIDKSEGRLAAALGAMSARTNERSAPAVRRAKKRADQNQITLFE
jgi:transposase